MEERRTVLVTGGGQGIGRAIAEAFAGKGYQVIILERDEEAGLEVEQIIRNRLGGDCLLWQADVSDESAVRQAAETVQRQGIKLNALVNNAGVSQATPLSSPMRDWDEVLGINLRGAYLVVKYFVPLMNSKSSIINIASTRAGMSERDWHAYAAAKGGLVALTHSLAVSLGPDIRVNAISPGWIDVTGWQKGGNQQPGNLRPIDHEQHPTGRVGRPEDIAEACLFLAAPGAGFITGANLVVDGGMTVKMIYAE